MVKLLFQGFQSAAARWPQQNKPIVAANLAYGARPKETADVADATSNQTTAAGVVKKKRRNRKKKPKRNDKLQDWSSGNESESDRQTPSPPHESNLRSDFVTDEQRHGSKSSSEVSPGSRRSGTTFDELEENTRGILRGDRSKRLRKLNSDSTDLVDAKIPSATIEIMSKNEAPKTIPTKSQDWPRAQFQDGSRSQTQVQDVQAEKQPVLPLFRRHNNLPERPKIVQLQSTPEKPPPPQPQPRKLPSQVIQEMMAKSGMKLQATSSTTGNSSNTGQVGAAAAKIKNSSKETLEAARSCEKEKVKKAMTNKPYVEMIELDMNKKDVEEVVPLESPSDESKNSLGMQLPDFFRSESENSGAESENSGFCIGGELEDDSATCSPSPVREQISDIGSGHEFEQADEFSEASEESSGKKKKNKIQEYYLSLNFFFNESNI